MTKLKVSSLTNKQLDWLVSCLEGNTLDIYRWLDTRERCKDFWYTSNWTQGGPIIERQGIDIQQVFCGMEGSFSEPCGWQAMRYTRSGVLNPPRQVANTPLIAAMRCYVASKLGDEVEIPKDLLDATRDFSIKDTT